MDQDEFINECIAEVNQIISDVESTFSPLSNDTLQNKLNTKKWSIIECITHLILSNEFYLSQIIEITAIGEKSIVKEYKPGKVGAYLARKLAPNTSGQIGVKMRTFKTMDPQLGRSDKMGDPHQVLKNYVGQLEVFIHQMDNSRELSLKDNKVKTALGKGTYLEMGNAFKFTIAHNARHIQQARNVLATL